MSQTLKTPYLQVNKQHKERSMTCITKIPKMDNKNHVDVVTAGWNSIYGSQVNLCGIPMDIWKKFLWDAVSCFEEKKEGNSLWKYSATTQKDLDYNLLVVLALNEDITKDTKTDVNMDNPSTPTTPTTATNSLAVLAKVAQSYSSQISTTWLNWWTKWWKWWSWLPMWRGWRNATTRRCRHYRTVSYKENWTFQGLKVSQ